MPILSVCTYKSIESITNIIANRHELKLMGIITCGHLKTKRTVIGNQVKTTNINLHYLSLNHSEIYDYTLLAATALSVSPKVISQTLVCQEPLSNDLSRVTPSINNYCTPTYHSCITSNTPVHMIQNGIIFLCIIFLH